MKYFDLTKRCEDGSVARRSSWAILSWRGKWQFYPPKIVVVVLSYSLIKKNEDVKKHLEVVSIGDNDLRRLHAGLHNHPHPALLGNLDHKSWCLVGFGQVLIEEVITQELTFGLLWSDHDKLALKVEYTREGQVLCPLTVLFDDATNQVHNLVWIGYYPLQSLIFKGYEAKIERSPLTSL